jgi:TonB family protein
MTNPFFIYLLESSICLAAFCLFFRLLLRQEPLLRMNRFFILAAVMLSLGIPLIDIPLQEKTVFITPILYLPEITASAHTDTYRFQAEEYALYVYAVLCIILLSRLLWQTGNLLYFARTSRISKTATHHLVLTEGKLPTFSFFRLLFWDNSQTFTNEQKLQVLGHEMAHIRQWHSLDIMLMELIKIVFWFHPAVYLFKKDLQQTHEYLADAAVVQQHGPDSYIQLIIAQVFQSSGLTLINPFSQFKTKNRIMMLQKMNHAKPAFWKMALSLPLIALLVLIYACDTTNPEELLNSTASSQIKEVVEEMPAPVSGLLQDISQKITYPEKARKEHIEGIVFVQFVVKKDGSVDQAKVINGIGYGCDEEAVKAVRNSKWNPGKEQGKPVDVRLVLPVAFALSDQKRVDLLNRSIARPAIEGQNQQTDENQLPPPPPPRIVYPVAEVQPQPTGGMSALMRYLNENIHYPEEASKKGIEGKVVVEFVVNTDGSIDEVEVRKGISKECDEEAVRVVKAMSAWKPGVDKGEPVNVRMALPINFKLD